MYSMHPRKPIDMITGSKAPAAEEFVKEMTMVISQARENIVKAQTSMKAQADKHRRDHTFQIGDQVMLNTRNLNLPSTHSCKLSPKWIGPFQIIGSRHKASFKLDLQGKFKIHLVFHVSLLKPWIGNNDSKFPGRHQDPPPPVIIDDQEEFEVEAIIDKRTHYGKTQYLVTWKGYRPEDSTWEPLSNLDNAKSLIDEFNLHHGTRHVQVIGVKNAWFEGILGQNPLKRGMEPKKATPIHHSAKHSNMGYKQSRTFSKSSKGKQVPYHKPEKDQAEAMEKEAEKICCYSMKKFVEVVGPRGEILLGYLTFASTIYYFRPASMVWVATHTAVCDCTMCEMVQDPEPYPQFGH